MAPPPRPTSGRAARAWPAGATSPLLWAAATFVCTLAIGVILGVAAVEVEGSGSSREVDGDGAWMAVALILSFVAYACAIGWIATIGRNGRTFGLGLVLLLFVPWWMPLAALGAVGGVTIFVAWVVMFVWPYRLLVQGIWEAGNLPSVWGVFGWLPYFIGYPMIFGPEPVAIAGALLVIVASLFNVVSLITVTILQHVGIRADRRAQRALAEAI